MADALQSLLSQQRPAERIHPWRSEAGSWIFNVGLVLFLGSLVFFGGIFLYSRTLAHNRDAWQQQIDTQKADLRPDLLQQLIDLSGKLTATKVLLVNHIFSSNVFSFLENATHPKVQYTSFAFSTASLKIDVSAEANSYETVAEQIQILEADPHVSSVEFGGLSRSDVGRVNFHMTITVKPDLLKLRTE